MTGGKQRSDLTMEVILVNGVLAPLSKVLYSCGRHTSSQVGVTRCRRGGLEVSACLVVERGRVGRYVLAVGSRTRRRDPYKSVVVVVMGCEGRTGCGAGAWWCGFHSGFQWVSVGFGGFSVDSRPGTSGGLTVQDRPLLIFWTQRSVSDPWSLGFNRESVLMILKEDETVRGLRRTTRLHFEGG